MYPALQYTLLRMFPNPWPMVLLFPLAGWFSVKYHSKKTDALLLLILCIVPVSLLTINLIPKANCFAPVKYDQYFSLMDKQLGDPAYRIGAYLNLHPVQHAIIQIVYNLLPYELVAVFAMSLWKVSMEEAWRNAWAVFLLYAMIVPLYLIFPAVGPNLAFSGFPYVLPHILTPHIMVVNGPPNCMPSGHFAQTLLTIWQARRWKWGVTLAVIFSALTAVATLGLGGHYVIDLLAAIPFTALIVHLSEPKRSREHSGTELLAPFFAASAKSR